ncbi:MAG: SPOR domain-containing protein, partial [Alphaproteobacteria bacterium]|nr:SPOR domain-containing protein [Alphaproteobacteria bacterium]
ANNLFLQLVSYKSLNKAKKLIKFYKESSDPILNKLNLIIVTANLSERGTYYRVRVGPYYDIKEIYKLCLVLNVNNNECLIVKDKK